MLQKLLQAERFFQSLLFFVSFGCIPVFFSYLFSEILRFKDFYAVAFGEEFSNEVCGWTDEEFVVGVIITFFEDFLGMVERQVAHIVALIIKGADNDALWCFDIANEDAVGICEDGLCIEVFGQFKGLLGESQLADAVKGKRLEATFRALRVEVHHIPSLAKEFDATWSDKSLCGLRIIVFLIVE